MIFINNFHLIFSFYNFNIKFLFDKLNIVNEIYKMIYFKIFFKIIIIKYHHYKKRFKIKILIISIYIINDIKYLFIIDFRDKRYKYNINNIIHN